MKRLTIRETVGINIPEQELTRMQESAKASKKLPDKIVTVVEAIHSGLTRNYTFYPADKLEKSVESWTKPYNKPVIKNHNVYTEPVGRVKSATFKQSQISPDKHTIELELEITDPDTIQKVLDGRYQTLSIGGSTSSAICSICGTDLVRKGYCGHMKGRTYEGKQAYWIIGEMEFDEISWVNVPADRNAQVIHKNVAQQQESASAAQGGINMPESHNPEDILEQIDSLIQQEQPVQEEETPETNSPEGVQEQQTPETNETPEQQQEQVTNEGESQGPTLEEKLQEAESRIQALETENTALVAERDGLKESVDKLNRQVEELNQSVDRLQQELSVAEEENKSLVKQNITLATYAHKILAESVARMKLLLGQIEESALEETIAELSKQTSRSLKEQISTLSSEKPQRVIQHVPHPSTQQEETVEESASKEKSELTLEEYAKKIMKAINRQFQ